MGANSHRDPRGLHLLMDPAAGAYSPLLPPGDADWWCAPGDPPHFADEDDEGAGEDAAAALPPWVVLIADDDPGVHQATLLALGGERVHGRLLEFLHAFSAAEAGAQLRSRQDVDAVLLDVVMESPSAGLDLIPLVRALPGHARTRIILRTGQPGTATEAELRRQFAIDGYLTKGQQTRALLLATLHEALPGPAEPGPGPDAVPH